MRAQDDGAGGVASAPAAISAAASAPQSRFASAFAVVDPSHRGDSGILARRKMWTSVGINAAPNMGRQRAGGDAGVTPRPVKMLPTIPKQMATWFSAPYAPLRA